MTGVQTCALPIFICSFILGYLLWLLSGVLINWAMSISLFWLIILELFLGSIIVGIIGGLSNILFYPILFAGKNKIIRYINSFIIAFFWYSAIKMTWFTSLEYKGVIIVKAIMISIFLLILFGSYIIINHNNEKVDESEWLKIILFNL